MKNKTSKLAASVLAAVLLVPVTAGIAEARDTGWPCPGCRVAAR